MLAASAPAHADQPGKAAWFPDPSSTPRYAWSAQPCEDCERLQASAGWQRMAALAGLRQVRFLFKASEENGSAYASAPNVIVLAPSAFRLEPCQLAFVVGHEMAHIAQRHFDEDALALSVMSGKPASWTRKGEKALSLLDDNFRLALSMSWHWQQQEREADWLGALLAAQTYGCTLEEGALPYLRVAEGEGGGLIAAHKPSLVRLQTLEAFAESARRLAFHADYLDN